MLIDWLTLRIPMDERLGKQLHTKIYASMGHIVKFSPAGLQEWDKVVPDWDSIRSDSMGLYWSVTADADSVRYLTIGASPSSLKNNGVNVFGTLDLKECSQTLINTASKALESILPNWKMWQCRRMDVTANYDMGNNAQVKQALNLLLRTDAPRRKANSDKRGGDSVYFNPTSTLRAGKAYHKGAHLRYQLKKGNIDRSDISEDQLLLADRLLRLELMLGSMWFRRLTKDWHELTPKDLTDQHHSFFSSLIGSGDIGVFDMGTLLERLEKVAPSKGRAQSAHNTWALIKVLGFTQVKASMNPNTFRHHTSWLRAAGLNDADLCSGGETALILEFKRKNLVLGQPVLSWNDLRMAA